MTNRVEGKVAFVTGAARGLGREHSLRLAGEGAKVVLLDSCRGIDTVEYELATESDLDESLQMVKKLGADAISVVADVRDQGSLDLAVEAAIGEFGKIDICVVNAGVVSTGSTWTLSDAQWQDVIDVNLTGAWRTTKAVIPQMIEQGTPSSIILTSSIAGLVAYGNVGHYTASKHGVTGLMRALAVELAGYGIRVNSLHPTTVNTLLINNPAMYKLFSGRDDATLDEITPTLTAMNAMPVKWIEPIDVANAMLYLASDESRYVTGTTQVVDPGGLAPFRFPHQ